MNVRSKVVGVMLAVMLVPVAHAVHAQQPAGGRAVSEIDAGIETHARQLLEAGRHIFRFDTFGSEAFWGDTLRLHTAIAGDKNGGTGGGVSPKTVTDPHVPYRAPRGDLGPRARALRLAVHAGADRTAKGRSCRISEIIVEASVLSLATCPVDLGPIALGPKKPQIPAADSDIIPGIRWLASRGDAE